MEKFYKSGDGKRQYWEYWDAGDGSYTVHWGELGTQGRTKQIEASPSESAEHAIEKAIADARARGFAPIELDDHRVLLVEFAVAGTGGEEDVDRRYRLQDHMDEVLGWTGLGHCDGGSIGSGTMEVCCFVVDFEIAKAVVARALKGTEFSDYTRIYDGNVD